MAHGPRWYPTDTGDELVSGNPMCGQYSRTTQAANAVSHSSTLNNTLKENSSSLPKIGKVSSGSTHFYGLILVTGRFADADNNQVNALLQLLATTAQTVISPIATQQSNRALGLEYNKIHTERCVF